MKVKYFLIIVCSILISCSHRSFSITYERDDVRINGGEKRRNQVVRLTKKNLKYMKKMERKITHKKRKNLRRHRKYSNFLSLQLN